MMSFPPRKPAHYKVNISSGGTITAKSFIMRVLRGALRDFQTIPGSETIMTDGLFQRRSPLQPCRAQGRGESFAGFFFPAFSRAPALVL
jgi:hypothetical protein